jgi:diacylglycerol kinase family enzyme
MEWHGAVAVAAAVLALVAIGLGIWVARRQAQIRERLGLAEPRHHAVDQRNAAHDEPAPPAGPLVAVVVNPTKPDPTNLRAQVLTAAAARSWPEPLWLETTADDPGVGQTRAALDAGARLVVAAGGDGTVRAVAEALAHTGVPMGLLPHGTGNLLARNLDLPLGDPAAALDVAFDGADRTIDVGRLTVERWAEPDPPPSTPTRYVFLVIGGVGLDAAMVADADETLKAKVGWIAYFVAAVRHLRGRRLYVRAKVDERGWIDVHGRSLLVGNVGKLPGGITLLPDARLDDGWLDLAALDARGGVAGWAQLFGEVLLQGVGVRNELPAKIGRIDHVRARKVRIQVVGGEQVQVDGESVGRVKQLSARVDPGALVVRVPAPR